MSAKTLLKSGRLVDPSQGLDEVLDLLLVDGIVASVGKDISAPEDADVMDLSLIHI